MQLANYKISLLAACFIFEANSFVLDLNSISNRTESPAISNTSFTYTIDRYPTNPDTKLTKSDLDEIIEEAFSMWSSVTPLQFHRVSRDSPGVQLRLSWERGVHRDPGQSRDCDTFNSAPLHWAHAEGQLLWLVEGWAMEAHIHFNDEQKNRSEPLHGEAGSKGAWARGMEYCKTCWRWPWQEVGGGGHGSRKLKIGWELTKSGCYVWSPERKIYIYIYL